MLEQMPLEILIEICKQFKMPEDASVASEISKNFYLAARKDDIWQHHLKTQFPHIFSRIQNGSLPPIPTNGWFDAFVATYEKEYRSIYMKGRKIRTLFSRIKAGQDFSDLNLTIKDLFIEDANGKTLIHWAREKNNQAALDKFYEIVCGHIEKERKEKKTTAYTWHPCKHLEWGNLPLTLQDELDFAILFRKPEACIKTLWDKAKPDNNNDDKNRILAILLLDGKLETFNAFIDQQGSVFKRLNHFYIRNAALSGHRNIIETLLGEKKKNITLDILDAAIYGGHLNIIEFLLSKKPKVKVEVGINTLLTAISEGCLEIVKLLLANGVTIKREETRIQCIHKATNRGHLHIVKYLLEQDQTLIWTKHSNATLANVKSDLLGTAATDGQLHIVSYLLEYAKENPEPGKSFDLYQSLRLASQFGHLEVVTYLLEAFRQSNPEDYQGSLRFILLDAVIAGHLPIVKYLLEQGADPKFKNYLKENFLHIAAINGHLNIVRFLNENYPELAEDINQNIDQKNELLLSLTLSSLHAANKKTNSAEILDHLYDQGIQTDASTLKHASEKSELTFDSLIKQYFKGILLPKLFIEKLALLDEVTFNKVIALPDYQHFMAKKKWHSTALFYAFQQFPEKQFKLFFTHTIKSGFYGIDDFLQCKMDITTSTENANRNAAFLQKNIEPFTPYRKKVGALIAKLHEKSKDTGINSNRRNIIAKLAQELIQKTTAFFINPTNQAAQTLFDDCARLIKSSAYISISIPRTIDIWRYLCTFLLYCAHLFLITIPFIWLIPASRNLLLDKTDTQAKAEDVVESIRELNQLAVDGKFNHFFSPAPVQSNATSVVTQTPTPKPHSLN